MTKVKFYMDTDGQILAYFPNLKGDNKGNNTCYAHIGQHSTCSPEFVAPLRAATKEEYKPLVNELIGQGYKDLRVLNVNFTRLSFNSHLWHNPHSDILEGHLNKDTFITYCVDITTGAESMEYYTGKNYVVGSTVNSYSRHYKPEKIPAAYMEHWATLKARYYFFKTVLNAYKVCALWASDIDTLTIYDLTKESDTRLTKDVLKFIEVCELDLYKSLLTPDQVGHSLWLTQNRHGAGFFDYSLDSDIEKPLTLAAQNLGEVNLFVNEGKIIAE